MKLYLYLSLVLAAALAACSPKGETIPEAPDYGDSSQWYIADRGAAVDVFYIVSTECGDYTLGGKPMHYADTRNDSIRALLYGEMVGVDRLLAGELNYYSPYYRQVTMETYTSDSLVEARMPLAYGDVRKAFDYYLEHYNNGRPFILAGFSQGAMAVVDLLDEMSDSTYSRLVAAYVIGYKVTDTNAHIRSAQDSADLGVTICLTRCATTVVPFLCSATATLWPSIPSTGAPTPRRPHSSIRAMATPSPSRSTRLLCCSISTATLATTTCCHSSAARATITASKYHSLAMSSAATSPCVPNH